MNIPNKNKNKKGYLYQTRSRNISSHKSKCFLIFYLNATIFFDEYFLLISLDSILCSDEKVFTVLSSRVNIKLIVSSFFGHCYNKPVSDYTYLRYTYIILGKKHEQPTISCSSSSLYK